MKNLKLNRLLMLLVALVTMSINLWGAEVTLVNFTGGTASDLTNLEYVSANGLGSDYAVGNAPYRVKLDGTGDYILLSLPSVPTSIAIDVKMIGGASASSITLQECATADGSFTDVETMSISGSQNDVIEFTSSGTYSQKYIKLYFTKGSNVGLGKLVVTAGGSTYTDYITECSTDPTISLSQSLSAFSYVVGYGPSEVQEFTVGGSNLTADISLNVTGSNYEISTDGGSSYGQSKTLTHTAGSVASTTVKVRLKSGLSQGSYNASPTANKINITSSGADDQTIELSGSVVAKELQSISVKTTPTKTTYVLGETFDASGLVINAVYNSGTEEVTYDGSNMTFDASGAVSASNKKVTVTYGGKTTTFNLTINCTVTWYVGGAMYTTGSPTTRIAVGSKYSALRLPSAPAGDALGACADHFMGWTDAPIVGSTDTKPTMLRTRASEFTETINEDKTFYAVFAESDGVGATTWAQFVADNDMNSCEFVIASIKDAKIYGMSNNQKTQAKISGVEITDKVSNGTISSSNAAGYKHTFTKSGETGYYYVQNTSKYIYFTSDTKFSFADALPSPTVPNDYKYSIISDGDYMRGSYRVVNKGQTRVIGYGTGDFGAYSKTNFHATNTTYFDCELIPISDAAYSGYVTTCSTEPTVSVSPAAVDGMTYIEGYGPSNAATFTVRGANLTAAVNVAIAAGDDFEISKTENTGYTNSLSFSPTDGKLATETVYVRLKSGKTTGTYGSSTAEQITVSSTGATSQKVSLTGTVTAKVLDHISIQTAPSDVTYFVGENFDPTGLVITATYNSGDETVSYAEHAGDFSFSPSTSTALTGSDTEVTVTYGGKDVNQAITMQVHVTWLVSGNAAVGGSAAVNYGAKVTELPTTPISSDCDGEKQFVGWTTSRIDEETNEAPANIYKTPENFPNLTDDATYRALFATTSGDSGSEEFTNAEIIAMLSGKTLSYSSLQEYTDGTVDYDIYGYTDANSRHWIQQKSDRGVYIKISAPGEISSVGVTITGASNSSGGIDDITKHAQYSGRLALLTEDAAGNASMTGDGYVDVSTGNTATITASASHRDLYLKTSAGARIWAITVNYGAMEGYITECVVKTPISDPTNLQANVTSSTTATISWNAVEHAANYTVKVDGVEIASSPTTNTSVDLTGFAVGSEHTWSVKANGEAGYKNSNVVDGPAFRTLRMFTITFNKNAQNGGSVSGSCPVIGCSTTVEENSEYTIPANPFTQAGYTKNGWNNSPECTETPYYTIGATITITEDVTFYANWTAKQDVYVDDMHGNTINPNDTKGRYVVPALTTKPVTEGDCETSHTEFVGWIKTEIYTTGTDTEPGGLVEPGGTKNADGSTYHAVWVEVQ